MACYGFYRAFQHNEVNCGFYPFVTTEPTTITSKPGCGELISTLRDSEGVALYSVRNPNANNEPAPRPAIKGPDGEPYVYAYQRAGSRTGWIRRAHVERDPNAHLKAPADGPASEDFEVGRQPCVRNKPSGCGRRSLTKPVMAVSATTVHLRYSPRGTSVHYLHYGDRVRVLIAGDTGTHGFHFCEVVTAAPDGSAKPKMRGWINSTALVRST